MSMLSDRDIKKYIESGDLQISNLADTQIGASSVDLTLDKKFLIFKHSDVTHINPEAYDKEKIMSSVIKENESFIIHPGEFVLGTTKEYVKIPDFLVGRLDGRSSLGRLGIVVHSTAGSVHPGFEGQLTLEIANISNLPVELRPGLKICQISFMTLTSPAINPYNKVPTSKYHDQRGPGVSKILDDQHNLQNDYY